ncbi:MAG: hypothetical protein U9Q82_08775, partial [Chloroflexota bacterium]|nr:hypothetical protein [Chloroflexota bacterium]
HKMNLFSRKTAVPLILVATREAKVIESIPADTFTVREAFSTMGVLKAIQASPRLMIVDPEALVEVDDLPRAALRAALDAAEEDGIPVVTSDRFIHADEHILEESLLRAGSRSAAAIRYMTPRVVLIANYCGGVGKTTLSLAVTRRFSQAAGLGTALIEAGMGGSSINARLGGDERPSLYAVVTQDTHPGQWHNVDVYPTDNREALALASDIDRTTDVLDSIIEQHTLSLFDTFPGNPLWPHLIVRATDILVVAAPRTDAIAQTDVMLGELGDAVAAMDTKPRIHLVLNMVRTWGEKLPLEGQTDVILKYDQKAAQSLSVSLADPVLNLLYPGWQKQKKRKQHKDEREKE